ncbi:uncharacterized protein LOC115924838 [Strongylocentrotus purpuratus]|uniref:Endonuclease/exonuclease/phosphatase domain-containing protein n=1 Tax=Strongylocentrotus purpuratus TaxID=7668 RepID=A0A7M7P104_STRPU|nr:uncharacterized protein LOC115924838 [Strongylocentrotus purpuratus]
METTNVISQIEELNHMTADLGSDASSHYARGLCSMPNLRSLDLFRVKLSDEFYSTMASEASRSKIEELTHCGADLGSDASSHYARGLCSMPNLQSLGLDNVKLSDEFYSTMASEASRSKIEKLAHFGADLGSVASSHCARGLCSMPNLRSLDLCLNENDTGKDLYPDFDVDADPPPILTISCPRQAFYRPPGESATPIDKLRENLLKIHSSTRSPHVILGGDFNVPGLTWSTYDVTSPKGSLQKSLLDLIDDNHLSQMVTFPIRHHQNGTENTLDLLLTTHPSLVTDVKPVAGLSDHCIVKAKFSTLTNLLKKPPRIMQLWKNVVPDDFKDKVRKLKADYFERNPDSKSVEENWLCFRDNLKTIVSDTVPTKTAKENIRKPWFTRTLKRLCSKKEKAYIKAKRSGNHQDWIDFTNIRKYASKSIRSAHRQYIKELTEDANTKNFWRYIRSTKKDNVGIQTLKVNNQTLTNARDKAFALSSQFESVFNRESQGQKPQPTMTGNPFPEMPPIIVDTEGVRKLLRNINTSKAIGPDQVPNQALKLAADEIAPVLQHLFQQSLDLGNLPEDWRKANITPIYKKGPTTNPANYRPVSLTCVCCKLLEHH